MGRLYLNGVEHGVIIDSNRGEIDIVANLLPTIETYIVVTAAFDAGRTVGQREGRAA